MNIEEREILEMALLGYGLRSAQIEERIRGVRAQVAILSQTHIEGPFGPIPVNPPTQAMLRRAGRTNRRPRISPSGRARIAAAARKRWAAYRRAKNLAAAVAPKKAGRG